MAVPCMVCGKMTLLSECVMDAEGEAFKAYYCPKDKPQGSVARCDTFGCTKCERGV